MSTFFIASLKHTNKGHEHIVFWQRFECGYTPVLGVYAGRYCFAEAAALNDGQSCIAVPLHVVESVLSPEPYWKPGARFYDQRGPVVDNTRGNWNRLIEGSLKDGRHVAKVKPIPFRGRRRSFALSCGTCQGRGHTDAGDPETGATHLDYPCPACHGPAPTLA